MTSSKTASCELEQSLFNTISEKTPDYIKENKLLNLDNDNAFEFTLKKEHLSPYNAESNPEGLGLLEWFENYEKEAQVSTAGIRGPQNILWPEDTRFPINSIGIMLATLAKGLVAVEKYQGKELHKIAASEVRYNSDEFLEIIARIQAALGIYTHIPEGNKTIPIWLASFLAFKLDLLGGEYITSSHGISVKNATKDLNDQGSQYLPEESLEFVNKIREIFELTQKEGEYKIKFASTNDEHIDTSLMEKLNNGIDLYVQYLRNGVATESNIDTINNLENKIIIENVGGCAYTTLSKVLEKLTIADKFEWFNTQETPFFHGIGKSDKDPKGKSCFYDWSVDAAVMKKTAEGKTLMPVIESMGYDKKLKDKPLKTVILITDPDHDRMTITQVESVDKVEKLVELGIDHIQLTDDKVLAVYTANQAFLMLMAFWACQLKCDSGRCIWGLHPRFMIKTTASAMSWDEWGKKHDVKVVNVPVGFKEIANVMKKVEKQIKADPYKEVIVEDVFGKEINLGVQPRLVFGGEESGGMIIGPETLIESKTGRIAVAMREKSATEAIVIASALIARLEQRDRSLSDYLEEVFNDNGILGKFDVREDIAYYNESEPDIEALKIAKKAGEAKRTKNDVFFLAIAMAKREGIITIEQVREILSDAFPCLDFSNLSDAKFVGDGSYFEFPDKYIEIRPSGTDAKTKAYGAGCNKPNILRYACEMGNYTGERTELYNKYIDDAYYQGIKSHSMDVYMQWAQKGADFEKFEVPNYDF